MSRKQINRKICYPPELSGFKPFGNKDKNDKYIELQFDEYESIKMINYDNLSQDEASELMNISRPTFSRIYNSALSKVAQAFVECSSIEIIGGNVEFGNFSKHCLECKKRKTCKKKCKKGKSINN